MKKSVYLGVIALATLSLTSCLKDEVVESIPQNDAIEFGTYLGRNVSTRGTVTDNDFDQFGVVAFYSGQTFWAEYKTYNTSTPNFMYNQAVNAATTTVNGQDVKTWSYNPKKYWPTTKSDKITFFAFAPMEATGNEPNGITLSANNATGTPTVTYEIDEDNLENMADFVADALIDQTKNGDNETPDPDPRTVAFKLNHELTRVAITAKLDRDAWSTTENTDKTKVNIKDIVFVASDEFATKAVYTFANDNDVTTPSAKTIRGTWSNWENTDDDNNLNIANLLKTTAASDLGGYTTDGILIPNDEDVELFKDTQYLFLIPRGESGISADGKVKIQVTYDIVTVDSKLSTGHSVTETTKIIELPAGTLRQGVAYNLELTFGLNEIQLEATVKDDWNTSTSTPQNVDWPKTDAQN